MKKIYLLLLLNLILQIPLTAQDVSSFERMKAAFEKAPSDTAKLRILLTEKPLKYTSNSDELLALYQQGYSMAKRLNDKSARFKTVHYTAMTYLYGKLDENEAYKWLQKALIEAQAAQNNLYIGYVYYAIGIIHHHQGNRAEMYKAMYQSVGFMEKAPDPVTGPFLSLAHNLEEDKKWKAQLDINKRLVALMERVKNPLYEKLTAYSSLADALKHFPEEKQMQAYYRSKALALLNRVSTEATVTPSELLIFASISHKFNRDDLAIKYAQQLANLTDKEGYVASKGSAHKFLSELYEEKKEYRLALDHSRQYHLIETEQIENRLTDDAGKKIIKAEAERDIAIKQNEVDRQQLYTYLAIAIAGLVILLSMAIFYIYRREQARKAELQHLNATKDKLLAILSHDLRSPVGNLENNIMLTNWGALSQTEFTQSTQSLGQEISQVRNMLDNVLHWAISQMKGMKPNKVQFDLAAVAEDQIKLLLPTSVAKSIQIQNNVPANTYLIADQNHLAVILRNLLQNALKFTHAGGHVDLKAHLLQNKVLIEVTDTGVGMSAEQLTHLFSLEKSSSRLGTSLEQGTGLGLVLVKELVEANGGSVTVESQEGIGTTFTLAF